MKECYLYKTEGDYVQCQTCNHRCRIAPFKRGICGVRENQKGKLYLLVYGRVIAENIDPIEKKPLYHFMPKTKSLSIATVGCNFRCLWCQNYDISQCTKENIDRTEITNRMGVEMEPEDVVNDAKKYHCPSISYTYTEPTIFLEYALDTMNLAREKGLKNIWVTNGYMSPETLKLILPYLDAANVDFKGPDDEVYVKYCGGRARPVMENIKQMHKAGVHVEITTLVVPGVNDKPEQLQAVVCFIASISKNIPWHISRFFPAWKMLDTPITPLATLKLAGDIGKKAGLKYIYLGNI